MDILVCVKRVPTVGGAITLTADHRAIDTKASGFTISPHEECAVEEAVRLVERFGGSVTIVSARARRGRGAASRVPGARRVGGGAASRRQRGGDRAVATAARFVLGGGRRLLRSVLLGNEASDTGGYQVGIRLAHLLGRPVATGAKAMTVTDDGSSLSASRSYRGVTETFTLPLPCLVTVKEGINLPRYPSLPGRLRAKRAAIKRIPVAETGTAPAGDVRMTRLRVPDAPRKQATVLGHGAAAVPALVAVLAEIGVIS